MPTTVQGWWEVVVLLPLPLGLLLEVLVGTGQSGCSWLHPLFHPPESRSCNFHQVPFCSLPSLLIRDEIYDIREPGCIQN